MKMETEDRTAVYKSFIVLLNLSAWMVLITTVGLGAMHYNGCPIQPHIPIYLIIIGVCGLILLMLAYCMNTLSEGFWLQICLLCILCIVIFTVIWFLTGTVWVFSIYPPNYNSSAEGHYCQRTLYLFAFWFNILCFLSVLFLIPCCICYFVYECVRRAYSP
ncbi:zgc:103586 isoform X1 [Tachysurus fulvidraco]|uniref:zgc:103586 isoform X1 n=1 Tax=Tachysurus fulvidraco TaxID=1234273 RepID=UPI001FEE23E3|nr:zgc:103586 isoform X1 [Tachysurus fulvidraco]